MTWIISGTCLIAQTVSNFAPNPFCPTPLRGPGHRRVPVNTEAVAATGVRDATRQTAVKAKVQTRSLRRITDVFTPAAPKQ